MRHIEHLIYTYCLTNPVLLGQLYKQTQQGNQEFADTFRHQILEYSCHDPFMSSWGEKRPAEQSLAQLYPDKTLKKESVVHVFPVWSPQLKTGLMVPLTMEPAGEWSGTSIFSSFNRSDERTEPLTQLLEILEQHWRDIHPEQQLPLRWRNAFSFQLRCPIHLDTVLGKSLQVPLIVMLLRVFCATPDKLEQLGSLPLGNNPVFCTGSLNADNCTFGQVGHVVDKARAFLREYGSGLPAVLTSQQQEELASAGIGQEFRKIISADTLKDLLKEPAFSDGLQRLAGSPHPTEIDDLLTTMAVAGRSIRFNDVAGLAKWLLPHVTSPFYKFKIHRQTAVIYGHRGLFKKMLPHLKESGQLLENHPDLFGLNDKCDLATTNMVFAEDSLDVEPTLRILEELKPSLPGITIEKRVAWWGSLCQANRFAGNQDEAVLAGREAVRLADFGRASDSGRDRNYLIHALIDRIRSSNDTTQKNDDLQRAEQLLHEAQTSWAPRDNRSARRSHLTFCLHYRAELARLRGEPFKLPVNPPWQGHWGHPWFFAMLSCARNQAHTSEKRHEIAGNLVRAIEKIAEHKESLFYMLSQVYQIYYASLDTQPYDTPLWELQTWCNRLAEEGFPGWKNRLQPALTSLEEKEVNAADLLCTAIPYH